MLAELECRYRLSRAAAVCHRAYHRILKCPRQARLQFGGGQAADRRFADRRRETRVTLHLPVYLRPAQVRGLTITSDTSAEPLLAVTQNVSLGGVGLVHDHPISGPWLLAEFDVFEEQPLLLLVQVRWTRELEPWSYRTGGRIAGVCRPV